MKQNSKKTIGRKYWRSLNELANTPEFQKRLEREFPDGLMDKQVRTISRRDFIGLMSASLALAGLAGCRKPVEKIIPYVNPPEEVIPGIANYYATTMPLGTDAYGLIVECHEGRPTKIEGNPLHPGTKGAAGSWQQASILNLYDPDRSKKVMQDGVEKDWDQFITFWRGLREKYIANKGKGLGILTEPFASPTIHRLVEQFRREFPEAQVYPWEPIRHDSRNSWVEGKTEKQYVTRYRTDKAKVILSLDSDFLLTESDYLNAASGFAESRRMKTTGDEMNRLYVVESGYSITGAQADHRVRLSNWQIGQFLAAVAVELNKKGLDLPFSADFIGKFSDHNFDQKLIGAIAEDLLTNRGRSIIICGMSQNTSVDKLAFFMNEALGNIGQSIEYREMPDTLQPSARAFEQFTVDMSGMVPGRKLDTVVIFGNDPVYASPGTIDFASLLSGVENTIHFGDYYDETARHCHWHIPQAHFLESWGDARAIDGTLSVIQPMIAPLYGSIMPVEMWNTLVTGENIRGYEIVRDTWKEVIPGADFEKQWREVLHDGILKGSAIPSREPNVRIDRKAELSAFGASAFADIEPSAENPEVIFRPSIEVYDGRFANNGWLQELPDPITKLTWDNAALMSIATARDLGLKNGDIVRLKRRNSDGVELSLDASIWIQPGLADFSISVALGYGRKHIGSVAEGVGFNAYKLKSNTEDHALAQITIEKIGEGHKFANTQDHSAMEGRAIVREATLDEYRENPEFAPRMVESPELTSIFTEHKYDKGYQWGMTVDLNSCIGCGACTIACQSENNIPVVGKEQVFNGREMHWIRNDRYFVGDVDDPQIVVQPMPCQQCENAPCETVCPVSATVHDKEGLNAMTYNRCIGTRYCSNNCPYKVRRFNFFNYTKDMPQTIKMLQNPDVTIRFRGVMEKCTFCIQRINRSKQQAKKENRTVRDGEILTACQQACPTKAITFGNINDPESKVSEMKKIDRNYALLAELNVKPRNTFLAKIRNPHPDLVEKKDDAPDHG